MNLARGTRRVTTGGTGIPLSEVERKCEAYSLGNQWHGRRLSIAEKSNRRPIADGLGLGESLEVDLGNSMHSKPTDSSAIDLSGLSEESRKRLHRLLYRQECRVCLLALGLSLWAVLLLVPQPLYPKFQEGSAIAVAIFLAFWVGHPGQTVLTELRKRAAADEAASIERKFDSSWQSCWDFVPPVLVPLMPFVGLLLYRLLIQADG